MRNRPTARLVPNELGSSTVAQWAYIHPERAPKHDPTTNIRTWRRATGMPTVRATIGLSRAAITSRRSGDRSMKTARTKMMAKMARKTQKTQGVSYSIE